MSDLPESLSTTPVAVAAAPQPPPVEPAPTAEVVDDSPAPAPAPPPTAVAEPAAAAEEPAAAPVRRKPAKRSVSEDTLAAWQQRLEQDRTAERRRQQAAAAKAERRQAFRLARQVLERCASAEEPAIDPALAALADDQLAQAVHAAPERIRTVVAATLRLLQSRR